MNEISKQLTDRKNDAVVEISNTFEELEKAMHLRKNALIAEVENICSTKQKVSTVPLCLAPVYSLCPWRGLLLLLLLLLLLVYPSRVNALTQYLK